LAMHQPLRDATLEALRPLGITALPNYSAAVPVNTPFVRIEVADTDPTRTQLVADTLAQQLILQGPSSSNEQELERRQFIEGQLDMLQSDIDATNQEIHVKQDELAKLTSAVEIASVQSDLLALRDKLGALQQTYIGLLNTSEPLNILRIVNKANLPTRPIGPNKTLIILVATVAGMGLAAGMAYVVEFWDRSVKNEEDVWRIFGVPVLGTIVEMGRDVANRYTLAADQPRSPAADAMRGLRANLEFASIDEPLRSVLITSVEAGVGKTTVSINLALSLSQIEKKVLLLDGDLRRPNVHNGLQIELQPGLSDALRDRTPAGDVLRNFDNHAVGVITAGSLPPNPTELLASKRMQQLLHDLKEAYDIVVVDSPPYLVTDSAILGARVDGVLLVLRPGRTREDAAQAVKEQLTRSGARLLGVVFNRAGKRGLHYNQYAYYSSEIKKADQAAKNAPKTISNPVGAPEVPSAPPAS